MNYEEKAEEFLLKAGVKLRLIDLGTVKGFPGTKDTLEHEKYRISLRRDNKYYTTVFYGSHNDWQNNKKPTAYDVLASLVKYDVGTMADFVQDFCYEITDRKSFLETERAWKNCKKEYQTLVQMFTEEEFDELCEIN